MRWIGCAGALVAALGCSSSYRPAASPRIAVTMEHGLPALHKNGVTTPAGWFYGGVEEVVQGSPRAEEEARTAHQLMVGGFVVELAGLASVVGGMELVTPRNGGNTGLGTGLLVGGLAAEIAALILVLNAPPHLYDAVNIYNDAVPPLVWVPTPPIARRMPPTAPVAPPPAAPAGPGDAPATP